MKKNKRFLGHLLSFSCAIALCVGNAGIADDNFDWHVDNDHLECYELTEGDPEKPCLDYWNAVNDRPPETNCGGLCNILDGAITCKFNRGMQLYSLGPDRLTEQLAYNVVQADPGDPQGNETRRRDLKCVIEGLCECKFNQQYQSVFCGIKPNTESYNSVLTSIWDAGGPACDEEEELEGDPGDGEALTHQDGWNEDEDWRDLNAWFDGEYDNENGGSNNEQP